MMTAAGVGREGGVAILERHEVTFQILRAHAG